MRSLFSHSAGILGLVVVLSAVVTLFFGNADFVYAKLGLAALLVAASFVLGESGGLKRFVSGRGLHFGATTGLSALALVTLLGLANWTAYQRPVSWDLTKDKLHTLQADTVKTLKGLKADVHAVALYRRDEPGYAQSEAMLKRYADVSPRFTWELVDPWKDPQRVKALGVVAGGPRVFVTSGTQKASASAPDEQGLTNALVKVTHAGGRKVYFTVGHGEAGPTSDKEVGYAQLAKALEAEGYEVATLSLLEKADVPDDAAVVLALGGRSAFLKNELEALTRYAAKGGHLGLFLEPDSQAGLDPLLAAYGVQADEDIVVDPSPGAQLTGSPVSPIVLPSAAHAVSRDLADSALIFPTSRSLVALTQADVTPTPLALTGKEAWGETDLQSVFKKGVARRDQGEKVGPLPVAMAVEKPATGDGRRSDRTRLVVSGDGDFCTNQYLQLGANRDFVMNAVSWLAEQEDRITIRPKGREGSRVMMTQAQATSLKFLTLDVLPVVLLGLGLAIWTARRSR